MDFIFARNRIVFFVIKWKGDSDDQNIIIGMCVFDIFILECCKMGGGCFLQVSG